MSLTLHGRQPLQHVSPRRALQLRLGHALVHHARGSWCQRGAARLAARPARRRPCSRASPAHQSTMPNCHFCANVCTKSADVWRRFPSSPAPLLTVPRRTRRPHTHSPRTPPGGKRIPTRRRAAESACHDPPAPRQPAQFLTAGLPDRSPTRPMTELLIRSGLYGRRRAPHSKRGLT